MPKYRILMCEFPGDARTHQDTANWVGDTRLKWDRDPDIGPGNHGRWYKADTPVTMSRNIALKFALREEYDYVLFVDSDMSPDLVYADAKPFWETSWEFAKNHNGPCVIAAPYCGPPPSEQPYVFRYGTTETGDNNPNFQLKMYTREEAALKTGIEKVAALPTGLMLIDMRAIRGTKTTKPLRDPYFYYEWKNDGDCCHACGVKTPGPQLEKASTEDVAFCRDLDMLGVPQYVNWDAWAGHWKMKRVGRPIVLGPDVISHQLRGRAAEIDEALGWADDGVSTAPPAVKSDGSDVLPSDDPKPCEMTPRVIDVEDVA